MKKKIFLLSLILSMGFCSITKANTNDYVSSNVMDGVAKQLMEKALYNLGSQLIDKFAPYPPTNNPNNNNGQYYPPQNYYQPQVNTNNVTNTTNSSSNSTYVPVVQNEPVNEPVVQIISN